MTILTSIILVVAVVAVALFIAYNAQRGTKALKDFKADYDNNAEVQQLADLAKELYNKDLRPVAPKKAPKKVEQVETIAEVVTPQVVEKVLEVADIAPVNVEAVVEPTKPKKKRKYYPRKK